jgi:Na+/glutamate symporter
MVKFIETLILQSIIGGIAVSAVGLIVGGIAGGICGLFTISRWNIQDSAFRFMTVFLLAGILAALLAR